MLKQSVGQSSAVSLSTNNSSNNQAFIDNNYSINAINNTNVNSLTNNNSQRERSALLHAHQNSFGFFITQDSSFGNLILPVLPRFS